MSKRILAIASGGGHWVELRRIMPAFEGLDVTFASVRPEYAADVIGRPYFHFKDFHRYQKRGAMNSSWQVLRIVLKVRPQLVISTGAAPPLFALGAARLLFGAKTIWIDSIANAERLSTSGKLARYFADVWLTQWEHLAKEHGPMFWGAVM